MAALLIRHKVTHFERWQPVFDEQETTRRAHGCQRGHLFRSVSAPDEVLILLEWDNHERAWLFAQSDDLREILKRADAANEPDVWFLGDANQAPD